MSDTYNRLIDELREKYPGLAKKEKTSRAAAMRLFCLECTGGSGAGVKKCTALKCTLWPWRLKFPSQLSHHLRKAGSGPKKEPLTKRA